MKEKYLKENFEKVVKESFSIADVLRKLDLAPKGGSYGIINKYIKLYEIDTTHFTGQAWNKGCSFTEKASMIPLNEILQNNTNFRSNSLKYRLVKEGLKEWKCEKCGCNGEWQGEPIILELHHINGNHYDNRIENLQILCPNCHSQTTTYRSKNKDKKNRYEVKSFERKKHVCICKTCGKEFKADRERLYCCRECYNKSLDSKKTLITKELLEKEIQECNSISQLAEKLNLSRPSIRKYLITYDLLDTFKNVYATQSIHSKKVGQYDLNMNLIKEWGSVADAEENTKIKSISNCANLKRKTAGGYIWRYLD